ncbi:MAG: DUF1579 domain-containing protein [Planctomycetota bacterium]
MQAKPHAEHAWLEQLLGEWTCESTCPPAADGQPEVTRGAEVVRSLGGLWVVCEGRGDVPGASDARWTMTLGYDPRRSRFVGSWFGSMLTNMFAYEGTLDDAERVLTLETTGPDFEDASKPDRRYRDVIEVRNADERTLTSQMLTDAGEWAEMMRATYRRTT